MTALPPVPPARAVQPRGCAATLAVLAMMLGIVGSGFIAAGAVASIPSRPVTVADGVVITPATGWEFGGRNDAQTGILLSNGAGSLFVDVMPGDLDPGEALVALLDEWRGDPGTRITAGPLEPAGIRPGQPGARVTYAGTFEGIGYPIEGEVTGVQGSSSTVLFDGWAGIGDYGLVRPDVERMIAEATIP